MSKPLLHTLSLSWLSDNVIKTLPIFISTNLVAVVVWQLQISHLAMPLILGIIAGGLVDLDNRLSGRVKNLLFTMVAFGISSLSAQLALSYGWLFIPLATLLTFVVVMLGALGQRYSTIAFGALVVSVYTTLTYSPTSSWYSNTLMILAGAFLYSLSATLIYLLFPTRTVQENLAKSFEALAGYLQAKAAYFDPDDDDLAAKQLTLAKANSQVMQAFDQTRVSLFYRLQGYHRQARIQRLLRYYFTAQDILERAGSSYYQYSELAQQLSQSDLMFRFQRVLELQAQACLKLADALRKGNLYQHAIRNEKAMQGLLHSLNYYQERGLKNAYRWQGVAENLRNIEGQLSQIEQESAEVRKKWLKSARLSAENVSGLGNMFKAIRSQCHFSSQLFRHAVRLSIVVFVCSAIVKLFGLDTKGYWILLTAIFVCQPNYSATKKRLIHRVVGTLLGVLVGLSFQYFSPSLEAQLGLIVLSGSLYTFFRFKHYGFSTFYITILVLISLDVIGGDATYVMLPRLLDTLTGTLIAWCAVSFLWPDWRYLDLHTNFKNTLKASTLYLKHILSQLQFGYHDQLAYRVVRREVNNHLSALSTAVADMHSEPKKYRHLLNFAPNLLGVTYTLVGYISALASYRKAANNLTHQTDFAVQFFPKGKQIAHLIEKISQGSITEAHLQQQTAEVEAAFNDFELHHQTKEDELALVLAQQLRLISQLLPQLQHLVAIEKAYHRKKKPT